MDEEAYNRVLEVAAWLIGGFGTIFTLLLSVIAFFIKRNTEKIEVRIDKHDEKFEKIQDEIHALAVTAEKTLTMVKIKHRIK